MVDSKQLLIIGSVWPEPGSSAAGTRMMQLINLFQSAGWRITFASSSAKGAHAVDLPAMDINCVSVEINSASFDDFVADLQPSAVMFDRFITEEQFGWRVTRHCPGAVQILDTEDLHCLRRARKKAVNRGQSFNTQELLDEASAKREIASMLRCDLSLIISEFEMKLLKELFNIDKSLLNYQPFWVDAIGETDQKVWLSFEKRRHFITVGNFRHAPNWDAVQYLHQTIWPIIHTQLPSAQLHIYGAYPPEKAWNLHQPETGFYIKGRAADAKKVVHKARICLVPLRFGAGLKGKLIEAMQCGTPSITTPVGAEGLAGEMDWPGAVAEPPQQFAEHAVELYSTREKWNRAQQQGRRIINRRFADKERGLKLLKRINKIKNNLKDHRRHNFTGAMLRHHTMASTKYMARWIEAKNR